MRQGGTDVVLTTQYLDEADHLADSIVIIDGGRVIAQGTSVELKSRVGADVVELHTGDVATLVQAADVLRGLAGGSDGRGVGIGVGVPSVDEATRRCSVSAPAGSKLLTVVVRALDEAGVEVEDISLRRPTLDEVFLELTGRSAGAADGENGENENGENQKEGAAA